MRPKMYLKLMLVGCCLLFTWYSIRRSGREIDRTTISKRNFNSYGLPFSPSKYKVTGDPVNHIAFIKLPKAGSTTVQNIFLRYGDENNLTFALPSNQRRGGGNSLTSKYFYPPPHNGKYDITCAHTRYNRPQFSRVLHNDTLYIGTVREPFSHFQSIIRFKKPGNVVGIKGDNPVLKYLTKELKNRDSIHRYTITCNPMSYYYLFPENLFALGKESELQKYLQKIGNEMDMILVLEYLDESVVLMRRILNWDLRHVLYAQLRVNKEHDLRLKFGPDEAKLHKNCAYLDYRLYDFFVTKLKHLIKTHQPDFDEELTYFRKVRTKYNTFCLSLLSHGEENKEISFDGSAWNKPFTINREHCEKQFIHDVVYLNTLKRKRGLA